MRYCTFAAIGAAVLAVSVCFRARAQDEVPGLPSPARWPGATTPTGAPGPPPPPLPSHYPTQTLGVELGWGGPYGQGVHYAYRVGRRVDVNAGLGLGIGGKVGVGARYFLHPDRRATPYFGLALTRTGRFGNFDMTLGHQGYEERASFTLRPCGVLHLRGGMRWQPGRVGLLGTLGYGARLSGNPAVFHRTDVNGRPSAEMRRLVRALSAGGLEISFGVLFGLNWD